jgi:DNA-binding CsgD family transcriptional regulator
MKRDEGIGFPELHVQLRITNRLLAAQLRSSLKQIDVIKLLASTGASNAEIADVMGTTPGTVKTTLQRLRKTDKAAALLSASDDDAIDVGGTET